MAACTIWIESNGSVFPCLYDEVDHGVISQYSWSISGEYARSGGYIYMHRLILGLTHPELQVDHIDHNGLNNQRSNLRICTRSENQFNRQKQAGSSQFKGVTRRSGKYIAQIKYNNQTIYLGIYRSDLSAAKAYDRASRQLHKEFGLTNFPEVDDLPIQLTFRI
jgi:hypothetical protein